MLPVFVLATAVAALWFTVVLVAFAIICCMFVFSAFSALEFVFALSCTVSIFATVVALSNLQLWDISFGGVQAVVEVNSAFYATVYGMWVGSEYYDRVMLGGSFAVFPAEGCSFDDG